jgi:hypothetical protein
MCYITLLSTGYIETLDGPRDVTDTGAVDQRIDEGRFAAGEWLAANAPDPVEEDGTLFGR